MWLTGFDVPNCSTAYLDRPMVEDRDGHDKATNEIGRIHAHARRWAGA
jgi:hypothetical protein